ncbi:dTDP-glucose 4,6-dehydratase [Candidatus Peregrinibacteria bacterium]|nr:dTDP-glucose 4,6-dehydratase [Candidatus Peregrinibacteria bacterium]
MGKRIFIAGGAGFIGSNFVQHLVENYPTYEILVFDALTYAGNRENLTSVHDKIIFLQGDIAHEEALESAFGTFHPEMVVNFAAETHVDRSIIGPKIFLETNVLGTQNLLECVKKFGVKRYVQISTDEVYGDLGDTTGTYFTEETPLAPNCPYAASKASADLFVRSYFETYKLPVMITRCTNNYGPYQYPEKLIPFFIFRALKNETLPLYGDGKNVRDWLYVKDHCRAIDIVLHKGREGEVYNIGGHNEKTNLEITKILLRKLGKPESLITFVEDRLAHDRRYAMDPSKIEKELGWKPEHSFEEYISETIEWYKNHQDWVKGCAKKSEEFRAEQYQ